jgi:hypothetical protein
LTGTQTRVVDGIAELVVLAAELTKETRETACSSTGRAVDRTAEKTVGDAYVNRCIAGEGDDDAGQIDTERAETTKEPACESVGPAAIFLALLPTVDFCNDPGHRDGAFPPVATLDLVWSPSAHGEVAWRVSLCVARAGVLGFVTPGIC